MARFVFMIRVQWQGYQPFHRENSDPAKNKPKRPLKWGGVILLNNYSVFQVNGYE